ncbi:uncharacterized protein METZ01_LOCUS391836, partial [marine metagenome]
ISASDNTTVTLYFGYDNSSGLIPYSGDGTYTGCVISVTDASGNVGSETLMSYRVDVLRPTVASFMPADTQTSVSLDAPIEIEFSEPVNAGTVSTNTDAGCSGSIQVSSDDFGSCFRMSSSVPLTSDNITFVLNPSDNFTETTTYKIRVTTVVQDSVGNAMASNSELSNGFTTSDAGAPRVREEAAVVGIMGLPETDNSTPSYTFSSNEPGTMSVLSGGCTTSQTTVTPGNNAITFGALAEGTYSSCVIRVTDNSGNPTDLPVSEFTVDQTAPVLSEVGSGIASPDNVTT